MGAGCSQVGTVVAPSAGLPQDGKKGLTGNEEGEVILSTNRPPHASKEAAEQDVFAQELKALKEAFALQQTVFQERLEAERQRYRDLEAEFRELKLKQTEMLLRGDLVPSAYSSNPASNSAGPGNLENTSPRDLRCTVENASPRDLRSTTSSGEGALAKKSRASLPSIDVKARPTLYKASWKQMKLFKDLSEANMAVMIRKMKVCTFVDGQTIVKQGTIGTTMYFIDLGGAKAVVNDVLAQELVSGDYFGEMTFAATCNKILKGKNQEGAVDSEKLKRSCDVVAVGATRCLELSVKDFLSVLHDDIVGSREAMRAVASLAEVIDKRQQTVQSIREGNFDRTPSSSSAEHCSREEEAVRAHKTYAQDIIVASGSEAFMRRRLSHRKHASAKSNAAESDYQEAFTRQQALLVPTARRPERRLGWTARAGTNRDFETAFGRLSEQNSATHSMASSNVQSRSSSRASSRHQSPRSHTPQSISRRVG